MVYQYIIDINMKMIERTKKEQRAYDRERKFQELKKRFALLKARLLKKSLSPDDSMTIQAHMDSQGRLRDYYISNPYLQTEANYTCVTPIIEDPQNCKFVYRGIVGAADNAIGVISSNIPLSEIVASPYGNIKLQEMLSEENAVAARNYYYKKIGDSTNPLKGHYTFFGKPDFVLGTIEKIDKTDFLFTNRISQDVEDMLSKEREQQEKEKAMREEDAVDIDLGGGMVVAQMDCWLQQEKSMQYAGINKNALFYKYMPEGKVIHTSDNNYVYIGDVQVGKSKIKPSRYQPMQLSKPFNYENVVLWTGKKKLVEFFLDNKFDGLNFALGDVFTTTHIEASKRDGEPTYVGGIILNNEGTCEKSDNVPESVKLAAEKYLSHKKDKSSNNVISLWQDK